MKKTKIETSICKQCKKELPLDSFSLDKREPNGHYRICRNCRNEFRQHTRLSSDEYQALLEAQNNACAICGIDADASPRALNVDHNHYTHVIRGLLCVQCNIGLGYFKDDIERLLLAVEYLRATDA